MDRVIIRPLERMDIVAFFGLGLPNTCQGWAVDYDGRLAGIAGVSLTRPLPVAFCKVADGLEVPDITVWRTALKLWNNIKNLGHPVLFARAAPEIPGAPAFLERLGFTPFENDARGRLYKWPTL